MFIIVLNICKNVSACRSDYAVHDDNEKVNSLVRWTAH
jgi:hypothetical protein